MKNITKLSALLVIAGIVLANNTLIAADGSSGSASSGDGGSDSALAKTSYDDSSGSGGGGGCGGDMDQSYIILPVELAASNSSPSLRIRRPDREECALNAAIAMTIDRARESLPLAEINADWATEYDPALVTKTKTYVGIIDLHTAVSRGDTEEVNTILKTATPESINKTITIVSATHQTNGLTALHLAAEAGNIDIVNILLRAGVDHTLVCIHRSRVADVPSEDPQTALDLARTAGHHAVVAELERVMVDDCPKTARDANTAWRKAGYDLSLAATADRMRAQKRKRETGRRSHPGNDADRHPKAPRNSDTDHSDSE